MCRHRHEAFAYKILQDRSNFQQNKRIVFPITPDITCLMQIAKLGARKKNPSFTACCNENLSHKTSSFTRCKAIRPSQAHGLIGLAPSVLTRPAGKTNMNWVQCHNASTHMVCTEQGARRDNPKRLRRQLTLKKKTTVAS